METEEIKVHTGYGNKYVSNINHKTTVEHIIAAILSQCQKNCQNVQNYLLCLSSKCKCKIKCNMIKKGTTHYKLLKGDILLQDALNNYRKYSLENCDGYNKYNLSLKKVNCKEPTIREKYKTLFIKNIIKQNVKLLKIEDGLNNVEFNENNLITKKHKKLLKNNAKNYTDKIYNKNLNMKSKVKRKYKIYSNTSNSNLNSEFDDNVINDKSCSSSSNSFDSSASSKLFDVMNNYRKNNFQKNPTMNNYKNQYPNNYQSDNNVASNEYEVVLDERTNALIKKKSLLIKNPSIAKITPSTPRQMRHTNYTCMCKSKQLKQNKKIQSNPTNDNYTLNKMNNNSKKSYKIHNIPECLHTPKNTIDGLENLFDRKTHHLLDEIEKVNKNITQIDQTILLKCIKINNLTEIIENGNIYKNHGISLQIKNLINKFDESAILKIKLRKLLNENEKIDTEISKILHYDKTCSFDINLNVDKFNFKNLSKMNNFVSNSESDLTQKPKKCSPIQREIFTDTTMGTRLFQNTFLQDGKLQKFPKISFNNILNQKCNKKENRMLVKSQSLSNLKLYLKFDKEYIYDLGSDNVIKRHCKNYTKNVSNSVDNLCKKKDYVFQSIEKSRCQEIKNIPPADMYIKSLFRYKRYKQYNQYNQLAKYSQIHIGTLV
ncbi:hypothetical protein A3Q56_06502 [Intoshia linei]|uniref:Uncharacterized protein n=1 Tax=Intoshia linei TaxID=1819745 RepID=A0A177AW93_9BILA|nr:hypothetical protein A3Q56_06502 [Intoshia linei]